MFDSEARRGLDEGDIIELVDNNGTGEARIRDPKRLCKAHTTD